MQDCDKIELSGLRFYGHHGVKKEEKTLGQWFEIDLTLWGDFSVAGQSDKLAHTLDYDQVFSLTRKIVEGQAVNLLEHLASKIMKALLPLPLVDKVRVKVKKLQPPLPGYVQAIGVEMVRSKKKNE